MHVVRARFFKRGTFEAPYLKAWGKQFLRGNGEDQKEEEGGGGDPPGEGRKRAKPGGRPGGKKKGEKPETVKKRPAGAPDLRGKLRQLREGLKAKASGGAAGPILVEDSEEYSPTFSEAMEGALEEGRKEKKRRGAPDPQTTLALVETKQEESEEVEDSEERPERRKKKKKKKIPKDPASQLLAQAAQRDEVRKEEKKGKKQRGEGKSSGLERAKALVKLLTGGEANKTKSSGSKRRKAKEAKRRRKKEQGSPSGSSGDSSYGEEEESSSSSEMLAPLQKRSSRQPGAVLRMLVEHAKASLDQSALVETTKSGNVTEGVKMASYFNLLVRPYHSATSRDMKEMHHLAVPWLPGT